MWPLELSFRIFPSDLKLTDLSEILVLDDGFGQCGIGPNSARTLTKIFFSGNNDKFLGKSVIIRQRHICSGYSLSLQGSWLLTSSYSMFWNGTLGYRDCQWNHHPKMCATLVKAVITCVVYMRWADGWPWGRHRRSRVTCKHRQPRQADCLTPIQSIQEV